MSEPHIPVLIDPLIAACSPVSGIWIDGTFGAGGYSRALLAAGAEKIIGIDQDPDVIARRGEFGDNIELLEGRFGDLDALASSAGATQVDGVVLDIGVSSMQLDQAGRGFSFMREGPLDMRMAQSGIAASDLVNSATVEEIADILYHYGEERASRRIARNIVTARNAAPIETTTQLSDIIEKSLPRSKPGQPHPATRSFQALRIAINDELGELARGLLAAESVLRPGGLLAVVTFHSLEDRIVKRFIQLRSDTSSGGSRHAPMTTRSDPQFEKVTRRAVGPSDAEIEANPRSRSACLRVARRLTAKSEPIDFKSLGLPQLKARRRA